MTLLPTPTFVERPGRGEIVAALKALDAESLHRCKALYVAARVVIDRLLVNQPLTAQRVAIRVHAGVQAASRGLETENPWTTAAVEELLFAEELEYLTSLVEMGQDLWSRQAQKDAVALLEIPAVWGSVLVLAQEIAQDEQLRISRARVNAIVSALTPLANQQVWNPGIPGVTHD